MNQSATLSQVKWSLFEKIGFRFSFIYFVLFIFLKNNGAYPFWQIIAKLPTDAMQKFIPWVGKHVLNLQDDITTFTNGSGDTTYDYVSVLVIFVFAIVGCLIWSVIDRNRDNYKKMYYWITVAIRFYVGLMLINYGLIKIVKLQFPYPAFYRLIESYGDSSPMGLAWTFLGFSKGYNLFMGIAEVCAVLLLFRRTLTAGAIITLMTATNVMMVNYFYDVPVKILSTHLVLMTLFLLSRDLKTLFIFFFTGKAVSLSIIKQPEKNGDKSLKLVSRILKGLLLAYVVIFGAVRLSQSQKQYGEKAPKPKFYGLYEFTYLEKNGNAISTKNDESINWKYLIIEREGRAQIHYEDKSRISFNTVTDTLKKEIKLTKYNDSTDTFILKIKKEKPTFEIETIYKNDTIKAYGNYLTKDDFLLMNRGFNWINEYPFNR